MEALPEMPPRRTSRYSRNGGAKPLTALTPIKRELLRYLVECRILSLPQLIALSGLSVKGTQRQMRRLFDAGLVEVVAVPRAAIAPDDVAADARLLYGSAPNLYVPTSAAAKALVDLGAVEDRYLKHNFPSYGPRNGLFLRHELLVRDVRVWLEGLARQGVGRVLRWEDGVDASLRIGEGQEPSVKPDAWFAFEIVQQERSVVLVAMVEIDRGTERGKTRWSEKVARYSALFHSGNLVAETGYKNARVLVLCPNIARCERLSSVISDISSEQWVLNKIWLTPMNEISKIGFNDKEWIIPGSGEKKSIL